MGQQVEDASGWLEALDCSHPLGGCQHQVSGVSCPSEWLSLRSGSGSV